MKIKVKAASSSEQKVAIKAYLQHLTKTSRFKLFLVTVNLLVVYAIIVDSDIKLGYVLWLSGFAACIIVYQSKEHLVNKMNLSNFKKQVAEGDE